MSRAPKSPLSRAWVELRQSVADEAGFRAAAQRCREASEARRAEAPDEALASLAGVALEEARWQAIHRGDTRPPAREALRLAREAAEAGADASLCHAVAAQAYLLLMLSSESVNNVLYGLRAQSEAEEALRLDPTQPHANYAMGVILLDTPRAFGRAPAQALAYLRRATERFPYNEDPVWRLDVAVACHDAGDQEGLQRELEFVRARGPELAEALARRLKDREGHEARAP
jgi:hypothetical protein